MAANNHNPEEESHLAERFRTGDRAAFAALVDRHQRGVYYLVWRYVRNDEDAKDVTQVAFVRAWMGAASFRAEASFRTWIYRIATNLALNWLRDRGRWRTSDIGRAAHGADSDSADSAISELPCPAPTAPDLLEQAATASHLQAAVQQLPPKQRLVVDLRVQEGLSFKEVAQIAECSEDAAKANFHHALKRLRGLLAPALPSSVQRDLGGDGQP